MTLSVFNLTAAVVSIVAFLFAIWEHLRHRTERVRDEERVREQEARNRSAVRLAVVGAQGADHIVQRAKETDSTKVELQSIARETRAILLYLASELETQATVLASWKFGRSLLDSGRTGTSPTLAEPETSRPTATGPKDQAPPAANASGDKRDTDKEKATPSSDV
jgi:hypothetical protein